MSVEMHLKVIHQKLQKITEDVLAIITSSNFQCAAD